MELLDQGLINMGLREVEAHQITMRRESGHTHLIDMSTPKLLAETDARMLQGLGLAAYFLYIIKTVTGAGRGDRIRQ